MPKPVLLAEVPFLCQLPPDRWESLRPYLMEIELKKVEVLPRERKWILHLSSSYFVDQEFLKDLACFLK